MPSAPPLRPALSHCLHVTSAAAIPSILAKGLFPQVGPLSAQLQELPGIFMFPSWADLQNAGWLFDEAWPHASEPALLCVDVRGLALDLEAGFEVVTRNPIEPARITVLAPGELDWQTASSRFFKRGGRREGLSSAEVAAALRLAGEDV